jgi:hypothetical protein
MKPVIAKNPRLSVRIAISLILQILLVVLLRQPHQNSTVFDLGILIFPFRILQPRAGLQRDRGGVQMRLAWVMRFSERRTRT